VNKVATKNNLKKSQNVACNVLSILLLVWP